MKGIAMRWWVLALSLILAGCGFHLRGTLTGNLPYATMHVGSGVTTEVATILGRYLKGQQQTRIVNTRAEAEAIFEQVGDIREKAILSVNAQGQVREYRLQARYSFRMVDPKGRIVVPVNEISLSRDITFSDSAILAKGQEENLLWRDINQDLAAQIIRRLAIIKPRQAGEEDDD